MSGRHATILNIHVLTTAEFSSCPKLIYFVDQPALALIIAQLVGRIFDLFKMLRECLHTRRNRKSRENFMRITSRTMMLASLVVALAIGFSQAQSASLISIEKPFSRATPGGAKVAAGYMTITNKGAAADRLVSASSPAAGKVEIHEMKMQDGIMKMRELAGGLPIEAGNAAALAPGGNHLMLVELKAPLKPGDKVPVTLNFEKAGKVDVTLDVLAIGAPQPSSMSMPPGDSGHMHKM
jgi:copper(I)-binding protein